MLGGGMLLSVRGSIPWDISTATYANKSFTDTREGNSVSGLFFKSDGTAMYVVGSVNDTVYQYTLSTAWDISTASDSGKSKSIAAQATVPTSLFFKSDGTAMYVVGYSNDTVYQYTLSTAWDISTATYANKSKSVTTLESNPSSLFFKSDGTAMYVIGSANDTVYQYTLSTAWDISTASDSGKSFSLPLSAGRSYSGGLFFKSDGTAMYILTGYNLYQYTLSTAWDISTASDSGKSKSTLTEDTQPHIVIFSVDGTAMYIFGFVHGITYQYSLT